MEKLRGIIFPEPDEITLVVIKLGEGPLGQVVSHAPITVNELGNEMDRYGFSKSEIVDWLEGQIHLPHTIIFDIDKMREDGRFLKEAING